MVFRNGAVVANMNVRAGLPGDHRAAQRMLARSFEGMGFSRPPEALNSGYGRDAKRPIASGRGSRAVEPIVAVA